MSSRAHFQLRSWHIVEVDSGEYHLVGFAIAADTYVGDYGFDEIFDLTDELIMRRVLVIS